ncbi:MAG: Peptidase M16 domain protein [Candidatus Azambacteria bacterium GW2011_GWA2_45_90]|uniref:Peptidase M16 domain protein n=1 Tax=Candidatus Azambacteria bacterium GW2011_GWA2_45_90 TaxID=1618614 RepID=A0A0G1N9J8_9BACT|nr:MAG: Peptidase M16 domain protein [Candidatus Azambacteria bacterium GW2011_GWA2_45_90]
MFHKTTLKNGLRVITVPMKDVRSVTVLVLVGTGSKYETREINGLSHFLEHVMFKGTKKRPTALQISTELDRVGAEHNAFTGDERTGYWIKADFNHLDLALDIVSDILINSTFNPKEIERERGVIIEEINMYNDMPSRYTGVLFDRLLYGDQPAGWEILGKKEVISKLKRPELVQYFQNQYVADNIVVTVAGKFFYKKTEQTHFCLGVRAYNVFDPRKYALSVLSSILGGSMSSRLWVTIREKKGLAYYIGSMVDNSSDTGFLAVRAGVNNEKVKDAIAAILREFRLVRDKGVTAEELKKAKDYFKGKMLLAFESSDDWAEFVGEQEIALNKILKPEQILRKINAVSERKDIIKVYGKKNNRNFLADDFQNFTRFFIDCFSLRCARHRGDFVFGSGHCLGH